MLDYVEVVLDDEDGVAEVGEAVQDVEQFFYVVEVQARGGLVQNIEGAAGLAARKFAGELDALGLAAFGAQVDDPVGLLDYVTSIRKEERATSSTSAWKPAALLAALGWA